MTKCAEHPQSDSIGKCVECGREICTLCLTATKYKIKASQNVVLATLIALADKLYCPFCIDKLLQKPIDIKCPVCGSQTAIRPAKKGPNIGKKFYVCVKYPKCKGKTAIEESIAVPKAISDDEYDSSISDDYFLDFNNDLRHKENETLLETKPDVPSVTGDQHKEIDPRLAELATLISSLVKGIAGEGNKPAKNRQCNEKTGLNFSTPLPSMPSFHASLKAKGNGKKKALSVLGGVLIGFMFFVIVIAVMSAFVPSVRIEILNLCAQIGLGDKLALNPNAESYFNQTWEGRTINLPANGVSTLHYTMNGLNVYETSPNGQNVVISNHNNTHNPTMAELKTFLSEDKTEDIVYSNPSFTCANFAVVLHDNAEAKGIRCAFVSINFAGSPSGHALDAFQTTDYGLVFVDNTGTTSGDGKDRFDKINIGYEISAVSVFRTDYFYHFSMPSEESITSSTIYW